MKISIAGTGYVGLSIATLLAQHNEVTAVDIVAERVEMINNKKSPIQDDYIEDYLANKDLNLRATLDAEDGWEHPDIDGMVEDIKNGDLYSMIPKMGNVFEPGIIEKYPVIQKIKDLMEEFSVIYGEQCGWTDEYGDPLYIWQKLSTALDYYDVADSAVDINDPMQVLKKTLSLYRKMKEVI